MLYAAYCVEMDNPWITKDGKIIVSEKASRITLLAATVHGEVRPYSGQQPTVDIMDLADWGEVVRKEESMFHIKLSYKQAIIDHALANKPIEVCGVIAGATYSGQQSDRLIRMDNVAEEWGTSFEFDPHQQIGVWQDAELRGEVIVAIYHSHTKHDARPSTRDIAGAAAVDPLTRHIIVSVRDEEPDFRVWLINNGEVSEQKVEVIE
jgi:proteasome lid subunit RPN8/RPN11